MFGDVMVQNKFFKCYNFSTNWFRLNLVVWVLLNTVLLTHKNARWLKIQKHHPATRSRFPFLFEQFTAHPRINPAKTVIWLSLEELVLYGYFNHHKLKRRLLYFHLFVFLNPSMLFLHQELFILVGRLISINFSKILNEL